MSPHELRSPFPKHLEIGIVFDELCSCGALRSEHEDTVSYGHGGLKRTKCLKFHWIDYIIKRNI